MKTVLVVGSGGREHALAWKLCQSPEMTRLILVPGNDASRRLHRPGLKVEAWDIQLSEGEASFRPLAEKAKLESVDFAVIGPDDPLADGIVDVFSEFDILTFGPTASAARIESSKAFAKSVMKAAGVPTASYQSCRSIDEAREFLKSVSWPPHSTGWVVKADGLALGKGVSVCRDLAFALEEAERLIEISGELVIEECLLGEELSWFALCDGTDCALFEPARDYKPLNDGNQGPNTGGMGAYSPVAEWNQEKFYSRIENEVFRPVLKEMTKRGAPFQGLLYAGLMVDPTSQTFHVIEFNARFGDPETQVLLPRLQGDLLPALVAAAQGNLKSYGHRVPFSPGAGACVVGASEGYPHSPKKGKPIRGDFLKPDSDGVHFFVAGATQKNEEWVTSGGRVFSAVACGEDLEQARQSAYQGIERISFEGMQYRSDIALRQKGDSR